MDREAWRAAIHGVTKRHNWAAELNWTTKNPKMVKMVNCVYFNHNFKNWEQKKVGEAYHSFEIYMQSS